MSSAILQSHSSCKNCAEKDLKLREMEDSLNDARDAIVAKKTQIMMLQKELGKMHTETLQEYILVDITVYVMWYNYIVSHCR